VATANQAVVRAGYPYLLTADWDYGYRSQRINELVTGATAKVDVADVERAQVDSRNGNAVQLVPHLLAVEVPGRVRAAQDLLRGWDFQQPANSAPAAFFNATWRHLLDRTFDELPSSQRPDGGARWFEVVRGLLDEPTSPWWDDQRTDEPEDRDEVLRAAMEDAFDELSGRFGSDAAAWRWGDLHTLELRNASFGESGIGPIEWLFNRGPYATAGGDSIVNATGWTASNGYGVDWVPSMRMVVDLGDLDRSRWVNLTGASGHAFHRYYTDQVELWRTGETTPMRSERRSVEREAKHWLSLLP
jgi:penicillin amidase